MPCLLEKTMKPAPFGRLTQLLRCLPEFLLSSPSILGYVMPSEPRSPRLAVLIDADNASAKIVDGLFEEIAKIGEASVRRIYGDFSNPRSKGLGRYAIEARHHTSTAVRLHPLERMHPTSRWSSMQWTCFIAVRFDGFCLVSSDSDFTRLAARIREQGVPMFSGSVSRKLRRAFRQACRRFVYNREPAYRCCEQSRCRLNSKPFIPQRSHAHYYEVITQMESEDGWVLLGGVGKQLANLASDFDPRTFGFRKLSDLVRKTNSFRNRSSKRGLHAHSHKVRCRIPSEIEDRYQNCDMRKVA